MLGYHRSPGQPPLVGYGLEGFVLDDQRNFAGRNGAAPDERQFEGIPQDERGGQPRISVQPRSPHCMVVVPEQRCALIVGIDKVARYPVRPNRSVGGCKPGVGAPVAGPWNVTAVQVHDPAAQNRAVVHLHGGHVPWTSDGGPYAWFTPANGPVGPDWVAGDFIYPNDQRATLLWYHDHAMGTTRLNAYAGLASALILRDAFELALIGSGAIPSREIPLIIQDKTFKSIPDQWGLPGDLWYPSIYEPDRWELESDGLPLPVPSAVPEFFGDTILVNGAAFTTVRANAWMFQQVLATGVHGIMLTHADTPGAVRAFVEGVRFPNRNQGCLLYTSPSPRD